MKSKIIYFLLIITTCVSFAQQIDPILVPNTRVITFDQARQEFNEYHNDIDPDFHYNAWINSNYSITWPNTMLMYVDPQFGRIRTQYTASVVTAYARAARVETNVTWRNEYLDRARWGAEFLLCMQSQNPGGGVAVDPSNPTHDDPFATGVSGVAFTECFLTFNEERYKTAAIAVADWELLNPTYPHEWPPENFMYYSNVNHHARPLWSLASVYSITGNQDYLDRCIEIAEEIMAWQNFTDTRDPLDPVLRTGPGNTWDDGGWYYYDYSPTSLPDAFTDVNGGTRTGFAAMRSMNYHTPIVKALAKLLEAVNQQSLPGVTTLRNGLSFNTFKNNLVNSLIDAVNYMVNLQETTTIGDRRRGYLNSFTGNIYFDLGTGNYLTIARSSAQRLDAIIVAYIALLRSGELTTQDITRLETFVNSLADHIESGSRTSTGWGIAEWYTDGMILNWSKYLLYSQLIPYDSNLDLVNPSFEDYEIIWELWSWDDTGVNISSAESRTGTNSIHIVDNNPNASKWASIIVDATPNEYYTVGGFLKLISGYQALRMHFLDDNLNYISTHYNLRYPNANWQYVTMQQQAPLNTRYLRIILYSAWAHISDGYWDDISLRTGLFKIKTDSELLLKYSLRNFPNPFNPSTKIVYSIPKTNFVQLKVYDIIGREIKTLVEEIQQPGNYTIDFNPENLASGVYFYRISAGEFSQTNKLILTR